MAFIQEYNFRANAAFVTDVAPAIFAVRASAYPNVHPVDGNNYGWNENSGTGSVDARDRNAGINAKLAGWQADSDPSPLAPIYFTVDLPAAGDYKISLALGDANYAVGPGTYTILDDAATLHSAAVSTSAGLHWVDATDVERTSVADWVSNNATATYTFASTLFRIKMDNDYLVRLVHLRIEQVDAAGSNIGPTAFQGFQTNAFQGQGGYLKKRIDTAFQPTAFQQNAFQQFPPLRSTGTLDVTLGALTLSATGKVRVTGTSSITLGALTLSGTGKVKSQGSASITLGALTLSATGKVKVQGTATITLDALTLVGAGVPTIRTAFQNTAFQQNAFQIFGSQPQPEPEVPPAAAAGGGGDSGKSFRQRQLDQIYKEDEEILEILRRFVYDNAA